MTVVNSVVFLATCLDSMQSNKMLLKPTCTYYCKNFFVAVTLESSYIGPCWILKSESETQGITETRAREELGHSNIMPDKAGHTHAIHEAVSVLSEALKHPPVSLSSDFLTGYSEAFN